MKTIEICERGQYNWASRLVGDDSIVADGHSPIHSIKELMRILKDKGLPHTWEGNYEVFYLPTGQNF